VIILNPGCNSKGLQPNPEVVMAKTKRFDEECFHRTDEQTA